MGCYFAFLKTNHLTIQLLNWAGVKKEKKSKLGPQCDQSIFNVIPEFQID